MRRFRFFVLIQVQFFALSLSGQSIYFSYLNDSFEGLKKVLFENGDYHNSGQYENAYFQGKTSGNYIKFWDNSNTVTFDIESIIEYQSLISRINKYSDFKYRFCNDHDDPIVYNYRSYGGNNIRFGNQKQRISVEYIDVIHESSKEFNGLGYFSVLVCQSDDAYVFHTNIKCYGLNNCNSRIDKSTAIDLRRKGYGLCEICSAVPDFENSSNNPNEDRENSKVENIKTPFYKPISNRVKPESIERAQKKFNSYLTNYYLKSKGDDAMLVNSYIKTGDFTGDGVDDIAIWFVWTVPYIEIPEAFFYEIINDRPYLVAEYKSDTYWFEIEKMENGLIYMSTKDYHINDPRCCPSIEKSIVLKHTGNQFIH